ncbi:MAG TPA: hypothetical protein VNW97_14100, partial [Candidatus Saccharimonadales bacterium]|nr:hypothetical protein [Candidatus Saccharimonadales bacterium]
FRQRQLIEARNEAQNMMQALEKGRRNRAWQQLTTAEVGTIAQREADLQQACAGEEYKQIRDAIDTLNSATMRLAELMMDTAVTSALKGQNIDHSGMEGGPDAPHRISPAEIGND